MKYKNETLNEREHSHGDYAETAKMSQNIKNYIRSKVSAREDDFNFSQVESLDMISVKLARILSGDNNCADHWKDIAGYANLISEQLEME